MLEGYTFLADFPSPRDPGNMLPMSPRLFIQETGRRVAPLDDAVQDVLIQNRPLREWQQEMVQNGGFDLVTERQPFTVIIPDTLFTHHKVLTEFASRAEGRNAVLVLATSAFGTQTTPVQPGVVATEDGWRFEEIQYLGENDEPPVDIVIDPDEKVMPIEMPVRYIEGQSLELSLPRYPIMTIHHWLHILQANQVAGAMLLRNTPTWRVAIAALWAVVRAVSLNKWKILAKMNRIGKNCDIHPTAVIEGSTIGDNVTIGPYCRVLFSTVGYQAMILPGAHVEASVIGTRAMVGQSCTIRFCVTYPESMASQDTMQRCLLGRGALTTPGSYAIDLNFAQSIRVPLDGELHDTKSHFLGSAFGHGSLFATGLWMASGRMVPNHAFVIKETSEVISKLPSVASKDRALVNHNGTLVPLGTSQENGAQSMEGGDENS